MQKRLQMALADRRRVVAGRRQDIDKCVGVLRKVAPVIAQPMQAWHAPGQQRGPVGHADRRGNMKVLKPCSLGRNGIHIRRLDDWMAIAAQPISPLLVGDEKQKIRTLAHAMSRSLLPNGPIPSDRGCHATKGLATKSQSRPKYSKCHNEPCLIHSNGFSCLTVKPKQNETSPWATPTWPTRALISRCF